MNHPLFTLPEGTFINISPALGQEGETLLKRPVAPKVREGVLHAAVLAAHPTGITLNLDLKGLRKLEADPGDWFELSFGEVTLPILAKRGLSFAREEEVWSIPNALLFDYIPHWDREKVTVMLLRPMQWNWRGRFSEPEQYTAPYPAPGSTVQIRPRPGTIL